MSNLVRRWWGTLVPEVAGVLFTADPVSGNRHIASIDANFGLGDTVVAGEVSPDNASVDRRTGEVLKYDVGTKGHALRSKTAVSNSHRSSSPSNSVVATMPSSSLTPTLNERPQSK